MPDALASDTAMKFADYVLENNIAILLWIQIFRQPCGCPPTLWAMPTRLADADKVAQNLLLHNNKKMNKL